MPMGYVKLAWQMQGKAQSRHFEGVRSEVSLSIASDQDMMKKARNDCHAVCSQHRLPNITGFELILSDRHLE